MARPLQTAEAIAEAIRALRIDVAASKEKAR